MVGTIWALRRNTSRIDVFFTFVWTVVIKLSHRHTGIILMHLLTSNASEPARRTFIRVRIWDWYHNTINKHQITCICYLLL